MNKKIRYRQGKNMLPLIQTIANKLNIDDEIARQAAGQILTFLQNKLDESEFSELSQLFGGKQTIDTIINSVQDSGQKPTGISGLFSLASKTANAFGLNADKLNNLGDVTQLFNNLQSLNIDTNKLNELREVLQNHIQEHASSDLLQKINNLLK